MAGSVNRVTLIGNLGADPDVRQSQVGPICNLRVATTDTWRDKQSGERREKTEWHSVVIFNEQLSKVAQQFLKKGSKVYIEGALQTREWQDNAGNKRHTTEIVLQNFNGNMVLLDGKQNGASTEYSEAKRTQPIENRNSSPQRAQISGQPPAKKSFQGRQSHDFDTGASAVLDDDIPW